MNKSIENFKKNARFLIKKGQIVDYDIEGRPIRFPHFWIEPLIEMVSSGIIETKLSLEE